MKSLIAALVAICLLAAPVLATSSYTEYAGSGTIDIQTQTYVGDYNGWSSNLHDSLHSEAEYFSGWQSIGSGDSIYIDREHNFEDGMVFTGQYIEDDYSPYGYLETTFGTGISGETGYIRNHLEIDPFMGSGSHWFEVSGSNFYTGFTQDDWVSGEPDEQNFHFDVGMLGNSDADGGLSAEYYIADTNWQNIVWGVNLDGSNGQSTIGIDAFDAWSPSYTSLSAGLNYDGWSTVINMDATNPSSFNNNYGFDHYFSGSLSNTIGGI